MTTTTYALDASPAGGAGSSWVPGGRLLRAEFLKLTRRRGLMIAAVALTVGAVIGFSAIAAGLHAASPGQYAPAGGGHSLAHVVFLLSELGAACSVLFAGGLPTAPAHLVIAGGAWLMLNAAIAFLLGLGLSALTGSQSTTIAVLLALTIVVTPLVASISALPDLRQVLPGIALYELQPSGLGGIGVRGLTMTTTAIADVLTAWAVVAMGAGIWRTVTRDS